jgi:hypothetical protein
MKIDPTDLRIEVRGDPRDGRWYVLQGGKALASFATREEAEAFRRPAEGPAMVRRFDADADHPLTYTHPSGAVAWLRRTRGGFRMMVAPALGKSAVGVGATAIADLSDAANELDAIVAARFGDNWTAADEWAAP